MGTLSKSLGTDVNSPVSAVAPSSKFFQEELMPSMEQMQTSLGVEEKFKKEKSVQEAQQQADILRKDVTLAEEENKKLREDPIRAKYQAAIDQKESAAYIPDQENPERLATILALTNLMGVAIGRGGKANAQTALAAQNGMLEGYQKGRADIIKQQKDIFDETQKKLDKTIDDLHRGMQDAAILYAKDKEAGHQKAMLIMAENQASFMKDFYDKNGMGQTYEMSKQIYEMKNKKYEEMKKEEAKNTITPYQERMLSQGERRLKQGEQSTYDYYVGKDGKTYALNKKNPKDVQEVTGVNFAGATKVGAKEPAEKSLKKGEYQAKFVSDIIGEPIDVDTASKAVAGTQYKQKLKDLQEMNSTLGGVPGLKVDFADYINKAIATKAGPDGKFSKEDLDAAYEQLKTDPKLSKSFSALSDDSKVMAKAELDAVMQNLQTKYGNRAPVAEFRATQSVLSRKNMSASSYNRVLANEIQATDDRLKGLGMKPTAVIALERHFAKHPNEVSLMQSIPEESNQSQDNVGLSPEEQAELDALRKKHGRPAQ